jgi:hypothetical protein
MNKSQAIRVWALVPLLVCAGSIRAEPAPPTGTPHLEVKTPNKDLGQVPRGQPVEARFDISNTGNATLSILSAKPG